ncbi:YfhO family protein, partial [Enterococcus faecium]|uniref:YfhO family protein n=2 Tax=Enterococcus TaxID=1350 RepID=UPI0030C84415
ELIMWLDAFIYLPLVILGIHRLMDQRKPTLLFVSYFLLFITNYYFGFMIGLFSFLYYFARTFTDWQRYKSRIVAYFTTSLLAGGASMIMVLPAVLDLRTNGETLSEITTFKTEATAFLDMIMKNMIGVYDTTKYGSIPFIYIGLLPLIFCLFYFVTKEV